MRKHKKKTAVSSLKVKQRTNNNTRTVTLERSHLKPTEGLYRSYDYQQFFCNYRSSRPTIRVLTDCVTEVFERQHYTWTLIQSKVIKPRK